MRRHGRAALARRIQAERVIILSMFAAQSIRRMTGMNSIWGDAPPADNSVPQKNSKVRLSLSSTAPRLGTGTL